MKAFYLLIIVLLISTNSYSQNCKYSCNERDEFTGNFIKETKNQEFFKKFSTAATISFKKVISGNDTLYSIKFMYSTVGIQSIVAGTKDMLMLKLSNDSIIQVFPLELTLGRTSIASSISTTSISVRYRIEKNDLVLLKEFDVVKCRFYTTDGYIENELKNQDYQQKARFNANCILN